MEDKYGMGLNEQMMNDRVSYAHIQQVRYPNAKEMRVSIVPIDIPSLERFQQTHERCLQIKSRKRHTNIDLLGLRRNRRNTNCLFGRIFQVVGQNHPKARSFQ